MFQVQIYELRVQSNPRVRRLKARVARLKAQAARLKGRVEAIKPRVKSWTYELKEKIPSWKY